MMRVLIVDDEPLMLRMLKRVVGAYASVTTAGGYDEALALVSTQSFDIVLADDGLGAAGVGEKLLVEVRTRLPAARRVLMSGHTGPEMRLCIDRGAAEAFVAKTFDRAGLLAALGLHADGALATGTERV